MFSIPITQRVKLSRRLGGLLLMGWISFVAPVYAFFEFKDGSGDSECKENHQKNGGARSCPGDGMPQFVALCKEQLAIASGTSGSRYSVANFLRMWRAGSERLNETARLWNSDRPEVAARVQTIEEQIGSQEELERTISSLEAETIRTDRQVASKEAKILQKIIDRLEAWGAFMDGPRSNEQYYCECRWVGKNLAYWMGELGMRRSNDWIVGTNYMTRYLNRVATGRTAVNPDAKLPFRTAPSFASFEATWKAAARNLKADLFTSRTQAIAPARALLKNLPDPAALEALTRRSTILRKNVDAVWHAMQRDRNTSVLAGFLKRSASRLKAGLEEAWPQAQAGRRLKSRLHKALEKYDAASAEFDTSMQGVVDLQTVPQGRLRRMERLLATTKSVLSSAAAAKNLPTVDPEKFRRTRELAEELQALLLSSLPFEKLSFALQGLTSPEAISRRDAENEAHRSPYTKEVERIRNWNRSIRSSMRQLKAALEKEKSGNTVATEDVAWLENAEDELRESFYRGAAPLRKTFHAYTMLGQMKFMPPGATAFWKQVEEALVLWAQETKDWYEAFQLVTARWDGMRGTRPIPVPETWADIQRKKELQKQREQKLARIQDAFQSWKSLNRSFKTYSRKILSTEKNLENYLESEVAKQFEENLIFIRELAVLHQKIETAKELALQSQEVPPLGVAEGEWLRGIALLKELEGKPEEELAIDFPPELARLLAGQTAKTKRLGDLERELRGDLQAFQAFPRNQKKKQEAKSAFEEAASDFYLVPSDNHVERRKMWGHLVVASELYLAEAATLELGLTQLKDKGPRAEFLAEIEKAELELTRLQQLIQQQQGTKENQNRAFEYVDMERMNRQARRAKEKGVEHWKHNPLPGLKVLADKEAAALSKLNVAELRKRLIQVVDAGKEIQALQSGFSSFQIQVLRSLASSPDPVVNPPKADPPPRNDPSVSPGGITGGGGGGLLQDTGDIMRIGINAGATRWETASQRLADFFGAYPENDGYKLDRNLSSDVQPFRSVILNGIRDDHQRELDISLQIILQGYQLNTDRICTQVEWNRSGQDRATGITNVQRGACQVCQKREENWKISEMRGFLPFGFQEPELRKQARAGQPNPDPAHLSPGPRDDAGQGPRDLNTQLDFSNNGLGNVALIDFEAATIRKITASDPSTVSSRTGEDVVVSIDLGVPPVDITVRATQGAQVVNCGKDRSVNLFQFKEIREASLSGQANNLNGPTFGIKTGSGNFVLLSIADGALATFQIDDDSFLNPGGSLVCGP